MFGGARGGGKSDGILGKWGIKGERYGNHFNGIFFRREMPQADDLIERAQEIYLKIGAQWHEQKKMFVLPKGGRIRFRPLENLADAEKYQGQNITDAAVEEAGNYPDSGPIDRLFGALRSAHGVPIQLALTANPGGPGHSWIRNRYIDPAPGGFKLLTRKLITGKDHKFIYIPSRVENNKILLAKDPDYIDRLALTGSRELVRAWLFGDWSVVQGAFFDTFSFQHVIKPFAIPEGWTKFVSYDHGFARPFSVGWWAVASENYQGVPKGAMVRYREWYGASAPNTGLRIQPELIARGIKEREAIRGAGASEQISYRVADPAIFATDGGPCIAELFSKHGIVFRPADNKRIPGWAQFRARLDGLDGTPMAYWFNTCTDSIRLIPGQQHDKNKPEDLDSDGEDHIPDETRYGMMSRPWTRPAQPKAEIKGIESVTLDQLWKMRQKPIESRY